jgi:hypothetical protein
MTWKCKNCRTESDDNVDVCWKCGYTQKGKPSYSDDIPTQRIVFDKYAGLRIIATLFNVMAWVVGLCSVLFSFIQFSHSSEESMIYGVTIIITGYVTVLGLIAFARILIVLVDIEKNTRK